MQYERPRFDSLSETNLFDPNYSGWSWQYQDPSAWNTDDQPERMVRTPLCGVDETSDAFLVDVELPGAAPEDIDIEIGEWHITVSTDPGTSEEPEHARPVFYGSLGLPVRLDAESSTCAYENGLLRINLSKASPEVRRHLSVPSATG